MVNKRRINIVANLDWLTIFLYLALIFMGWLNIYSAVYNEEHQSIVDFSQRYGKQLIWMIASLVIAFFILVIDSRFYSLFAYFLYGVIIVLLIGVLFFGKEIHGSRSWFVIGNFQFQPAEFAKVVTALALARFVSAPNRDLGRFKSLIQTALIIFLPALLIVLQHDAGSALVYAALLLPLYREGLSAAVLFVGLLVVILFFLTLVVNKLFIVIGLMAIAWIVFWLINRSFKNAMGAILIFGSFLALIWGINDYFDWNISWYFLITLALALASVVYLTIAYFKKIAYVALFLAFLFGSMGVSYSVNYVFNNVLKEHQQKRINILLGIESDPQGVGYNVQQSKIAIGSGGLSGKGFLQGTQTKFDFVPEQSTDFIFCTVGEEWGFLGSFVLLILFMILLIRLISLAERQRSQFSRVFGYSVVSILFFHVAINIGMTIGLLPVIGIPLPFFSYGGSSLWGFTLMLFIFLRLDASRREILS